MKLVKRSQKLSFMEGTSGTFNRMKAFTAFSKSKNPKEYTRQYVDLDQETTDVVAISTSVEFNFDQMENDEVHSKLVDIIDGEKIGADAIVTLLSVDLSKPGATADSFVATKRDFVLVPGTEGDKLEAYSYGGTFKVKGQKITGEATSTDNWETCTFVEDGAGI
ncbi:hypothetical protein [Senegalia massiliensis]|uniref:Phage tail protein n=1 Tax=Senegalia massiliensis TaxID=1720316 RepID=A0A845R0F6_9CLOT|nr:hypothetical protein [Senegalia massiliensis]NBI08061.1 hypothetical protein [Senegalia massiliensis]